MRGRVVRRIFGRGRRHGLQGLVDELAYQPLDVCGQHDLLPLGVQMRAASSASGSDRSVLLY